MSNSLLLFAAGRFGLRSRCRLSGRRLFLGGSFDDFETRNVDGRHPNGRELLTVTGVATRVLAATQLLHFELRPLLEGVDHFRLDGRVCDGRLADDAGPTAVGEQNLIKRQLLPFFTLRAKVDREGFARLSTKLMATLLNDRKHSSRRVYKEPSGRKAASRCRLRFSSSDGAPRSWGCNSPENPEEYRFRFANASDPGGEFAPG